MIKEFSVCTIWLLNGGKSANIYKYHVAILISTSNTYEKRWELDTALQHHQPTNPNSKSFWKMGVDGGEQNRTTKASQGSGIQSLISKLAMSKFLAISKCLPTM